MVFFLFFSFSTKTFVIVTLFADSDIDLSLQSEVPHRTSTDSSLSWIPSADGGDLRHSALADCVGFAFVDTIKFE
jgi:hypothetical protein